MSIRAFRKRQSEFKEILSSNSSLNPNRFFRLMALAALEVLCCIPLAITSIVLNATRGEVRPWISWEDTHWGFSRVDQIPSLIWRSDPTANVSLEMSRWLVVVCGSSSSLSLALRMKLKGTTSSRLTLLLNVLVTPAQEQGRPRLAQESRAQLGITSKSSSRLARAPLQAVSPLKAVCRFISTRRSSRSAILLIRFRTLPRSRKANTMPQNLLLPVLRLLTL